MAIIDAVKVLPTHRLRRLLVIGAWAVAIAVSAPWWYVVKPKDRSIEACLATNATTAQRLDQIIVKYKNGAVARVQFNEEPTE